MADVETVHAVVNGKSAIDMLSKQKTLQIMQYNIDLG